MRKDDLIREEDFGWAELRALASSVSTERSLEPGYQHDWSLKDLLSHRACWMAEAAQALEQIRLGTYTPRVQSDEEVDALNERFKEACADLDLDSAWAQLHSARARMLEELDRLPESLLDDTAVEWFRDNGADHYREHLPRLRDWVGRLGA